MKIDKILTIIALSAFIIGCGQKNNDEKADKSQAGSNQSEQQENVVEMNSEPTFKESEIAKFTIASIMDQKPEIINVKEDNKIFNVSYQRPDDEKKYEYKVKINGKEIIWGNADGRWRDTQYDEKISYEENSDKLIIIQTFDDGSKTKKEFSLEE